MYEMVISIVITLLIVILIIISRIIHNRGDYKDGGGTKIGGIERISFFSPANDKAGFRGERIVNYHLRPLLRKDEYLLVNLLVPVKNGHYIEIDCIMISRKGIFCIETKKWVGHISGNDEDEYWIQRYDDPYKRDKQHRNPVKQNLMHCFVLKRAIKNDYNIECAVIFAKLEDGTRINSNYTYSVREFKAYYRNQEDNKLSIDEIKRLCQELSCYIATPEQLKEYRKNANNRYIDM